MSRVRPKFAYRIIGVDELRYLPHHVPGFTRLKLAVERIAAPDIPAGGVVWDWKWNARKKAGFASPESRRPT
jgi:hypothetical protein